MRRCNQPRNPPHIFLRYAASALSVWPDTDAARHGPACLRTLMLRSGQSRVLCSGVHTTGLRAQRAVLSQARCQLVHPRALLLSKDAHLFCVGRHRRSARPAVAVSSAPGNGVGAHADGLDGPSTDPAVIFARLKKVMHSLGSKAECCCESSGSSQDPGICFGFTRH